MEPSKEPKEVACVVCGMKSLREDWQDKDSPACDGHTPDEVKAASAARAAPPTKNPASKKASAPSDY